MTYKMVVAYVCDERYLAYLKISMDSIRRYNKDVEFVVLTSQPFEIEGAKVYTFVPDSHLFKYRANDRMREGVYYKFYLPKLPYNKILYIDCDVICQRPLNPLWEEECPFICATESHSFGKKQAEQLGVKKYALSGMMLMNLEALRSANFTERCLERLSKENPQWHDETIINLEFNDKIRFIDKKYNYCRKRMYDNPIPEGDAYLLHYVGGQKSEMLELTNFRGLDAVRKFMFGKSVAIVGNARSLLDKNQGKEIDSHDVVIRFNRGFPGPKVGNKTSLLFLATTLSLNELKLFGRVVLIKRSKLSKNICHFSINPADRVSLCQGASVYASKMGYKESQPSTGFVAINFALSTQASSIDLYGFDFFESPTYYNQVGYQTLHNGEKEAEKVLEYQKWGLLNIK